MKLLYRIDEVAEQFSISIRSVYNLVYEGKLEAINDSPGERGIRITGKSMMQYIENYKIDPLKMNTEIKKKSPSSTRKVISKGIEG